MDTNNNVYFFNRQYIFGNDFFSNQQLLQENMISVDKFCYQPLSDASVCGLVFVERDKKQGVLTFHSGGQGGYGGVVYSSNIYPFLYDEMLLNGSFEGNDIGYVAVRINHFWGILRVEGVLNNPKLKARRPCMMIIPCIYPDKNQVIAKIRPSEQYHPEFGWRDPFKKY